jgi:AsmA family protein
MSDAKGSSAVRPIRWQRVAAVGLVVAVVALGVCEALGWPFLGGPMQGALGDALQRKVSLGPPGSNRPEVKIHLLGGIDIQASRIEIGAPPWSQAAHTLLAENARIKLGYADLWRASRGQALRIRELRAATLDGKFERLADGRASWQFGSQTNVPDTTEKPTKLPVFGLLQFDSGTLSVRDALLDAQLDATYSLAEGSATKPVVDRADRRTPSGLVFNGTGTYQKQPLRIHALTTGILPVISDDAGTPLPIEIDAKIGGAHLVFNGTATDALRLTALKGRFDISGPSLAALGDPLKVTLPSTPAFRTRGAIAKQGAIWNAFIETASIGASRLRGAFQYDPRTGRPLLSGRLSGSKLALADLGPAVGAPAGPAKATAVPVAASASSRVLPDRDFDLPSLRAMDANVLIDIDNFDLGTALLEPLKPLRAHLVLTDGVLTLRDLDARTGQGRLAGMLELDGRDRLARWNADLRWSGVRLEHWVHQARKAGAPPYATGNLAGRARVAGQGKSTAAILGSLGGEIRMRLTDATLSHLAIEAAGLDVAQALGEWVKGDDALPVQCAVGDLVVTQGVLQSRAVVVDTPDSAVWVSGSVSLASEGLDLRVVTTPKDVSPLSLRTPITLRGTFSKPSVSVEKGKLAARVGASALLALLNPFAAILPLIDPGDSAEAKRDGALCSALAQRMTARPSLPAPPRSAPAHR